MKKENKTKLLGAFGLLVGAVVLSGCTSNFCTNQDKAFMAYPYEQGVTVYCDKDQIPEAYQASGLNWQPIAGNDKVYAFIPVDSQGGFSAEKATFLVDTIISTATTDNYAIPSQEYFKQMDQKVLDASIAAWQTDKTENAGDTSVPLYDKTVADLTAADLNPFSSFDCVGNETGVTQNYQSILRNYGYIKFYGTDLNLWTNWTTWTEELKVSLGTELCPDSDFASLYQTSINNKVSAQRTCIVTVSTATGKFGHYGDSLNWEVNITTKNWGDAWKQGFLEGLIVYPVTWLVDTMTVNLNPNFAAAGEIAWAQITALILVTLIVRAVVLALTFKSTMDQQKTQALQPQLAKLQAKYPNSNSNKAEAARLSQEQMALYKRNKVNPLSMFVALIVQFPVFIAVWGALQGSAILSTGEILNLRLSDSIQTVLLDFSGTWYLNTSGWWTAFVLFVLMSAFQWLAMMLPQWMTKKRTKNIARVSANPAMDKQTNTMKWVSYGMLAFTIIMGFALPAAMGIYWAIGALISMIQTVITQSIMAKNQAKEKRL